MRVLALGATVGLGLLPPLGHRVARPRARPG